MCKSHFMIMIHSEWCLLLFTCLLWDEPAIYIGVRRRGGGGELSKKREKQQQQQNHAQEKKEKKLVHKEASMGKELSYFQSYSNKKC